MKNVAGNAPVFDCIHIFSALEDIAISVSKLFTWSLSVWQYRIGSQ